MVALARELGAACRISVARLRPAESDVRGTSSTRSKTTGAVRQVRGDAEVGFWVVCWVARGGAIVFIYFFEICVNRPYRYIYIVGAMHGSARIYQPQTEIERSALELMVSRVPRKNPDFYGVLRLAGSRCMTTDVVVA